MKYLEASTYRVSDESKIKESPLSFFIYSDNFLVFFRTATAIEELVELNRLRGGTKIAGKQMV
jgi:hypothetical protein